jgi:hypothetical protein
VRQRTARPTRKVTAGGLTGMVTAVLIYAALSVWHIALPLEVATALAGIVVAVVGWLAAYLTPPGRRDQPIEDHGRGGPEDAPVPAARRRPHGGIDT